MKPWERRVISVTGLGYVGLPLAVAFAEKFKIIGFDLNERRITELNQGVDRTGEVESQELRNSNFKATSQLEELAKANFHIVAVPTPVNDAKQPDLEPLLVASRNIGKVLKKGDIVVYESTVYPGLTEEECLPILEKESGLKGGVDFKVGYSPERINPGDREHSFKKIRKVVSGQDAASLDEIEQVYQSILDQPVYRAASIKVAEAAKVIENTQRDLNIALMNELAIIFNLLGIDTQEVLAAAGTKWNFLKFVPGLVGGHCIGVDPYYLTHKAEKIGYISEVILAGRRINDRMGKYTALQLIKAMVRAGHSLRGAKVTVFGLTFKENCPDLRNSKVVDIVNELKEFGLTVQVHDPLADQKEALAHYGIELVKWDDLKPAIGGVLAVAHDSYKKLNMNEFAGKLEKGSCLMDIKSILNQEAAKTSGIGLLRL